MLVSMLPPDNSHQLRSENVHLEADGPGFDSQHLHNRFDQVFSIVGSDSAELIWMIALRIV